MGVIFFNVPEARKELMIKGVVYTLRQKRFTGRTTAVVGSLYKHKSIAKVLVEECFLGIPIVRECGYVEEDLLKTHVNQSGFEDTDIWIKIACDHNHNKPVNLYLYEVTLLEVLPDGKSYTES